MESLSTHEQLAAITGTRVAQLSGPEAERRLRLATNMIQRLQAVVRLWLKRVRKRREGYKVTMRTELSYASSSSGAMNGGAVGGEEAPSSPTSPTRRPTVMLPPRKISYTAANAGAGSPNPKRVSIMA